MANMQYRGRLISLIFVILSVAGWAIYGYNMYGSYAGEWNRISAFFVASIVYGGFGWWAGQQYDQIKYLSEKDALTEIFNRRFTLRTFPKLLALMDRKNENLSVLMIDVNNFKRINDTYGHNVGDTVLRDVSNILIKHTRESDLVARWAGDEFLIIAPYTDKHGAAFIMNRIEHALLELSKSKKINISVSIGISIYPDQGKCIEDLVKVADRNMYEKKPYVELHTGLVGKLV
jgi:diguanylate cyclase (GGDEF)-like protein